MLSCAVCATLIRLLLIPVHSGMCALMCLIAYVHSHPCAVMCVLGSWLIHLCPFLLKAIGVRPDGRWLAELS